MNIFYIYLLLAVNFVTTVVAYYRRCYEEFSVCLITNTDNNPSRGSEFRLNQRLAVTWCIRNSSSLAVITNGNVQSALAAFITDSSAKLDSDVIITNGYRYNPGYWEWTNGKRSAIYPFSERNDYRYGYLLVSSGRNATIYGSIPITDRKFICSYFNCPKDHLQFGNSCYKIHNNTAAKWFEARNLCLQEKNDLATFEDNDLSSNSGWLPYGNYWIGLRRERWYWSYGQTLIEIKYSNWDTYSPYAGGGDCLCLTANTGKWKECDCSQKHRYICIQDYTPDSSTAPVSTTTLLATDTTVTTRTDPSSAPTTTRIPTTTTQTDVNFVTTVVTYYRKCYKEFSVCLITNIDDARYPYKFRLDQRSADDWCQEKSSSLVFITNASVQSAIETFIKESSAKLNSDVITDGYRNKLYYWEWTNGNRSVNYPYSERIYYHYGYLQVSGRRSATLKAGNPTTARNFICSHLSHNSSCPNDNHQLGSSCYKIHNSETANWFDARNRCLQEGYDLATFADIDLSSISGRLPNVEYWIGLRSESWYWFKGQKPAAINYSNWDTYSPNAIGGSCLCLTANTGKWKDCNCSQKHRYICVQDYTPDSSASPASTTKLLTIDTIATRTDPSSAPTTTRITKTDGLLLVIGLGIGCLLILIPAIAVVVHIRTRRSSSHDPRPSCDAPSATTVTNADAPNTIYAEIIPKASESTRLPSEGTPNQIVYAELDLIPKGNKDGKALQELEYANSIQLNSVYARCAHTRV